MASILKSFAILGVDAYLVDVEVKQIDGQPQISIVGLGDTAVKEARERVQAAINDGGYVFPQKKTVINLAPGDLKKSGSHFDLAMAIGVLLETEQITKVRDEEFAFIGELSLNAKIRSCSGVLPMIIAAKESGTKNIITPRDNLDEAILVDGVNVYGFDSLNEVIDFLENRTEYMPAEIAKQLKKDSLHKLDFKDVQGQDALIEYIVTAASGGHNLLMIGQPGCGKSMIAKRIPTILPSLTDEEALEVTKIYSVAGIPKEKGDLVLDRPFRAPHHNASTNSLIGGGNIALPGEISLAHNGVLFLDEIAEFAKKALDSLRQPMEDQEVTISRVRYTNTYPASFMLVAAMNPCPCGYYGSDKCQCTDYEIVKYRQKISGPIMDRIDIQKYVRPVDFMKISSYSMGKTSAELRERVEFARRIREKRFMGIENVRCNAQMNNSLVKEHCRMEAAGQKLMELAYEKFRYSARSFYKYLKVARTHADMDDSKNLREKDIAFALISRDLDKDQSVMAVL